MLRTPRHRQEAYATRPAPYDQHECRLDQPFDFREPKEANLRPKQVECADCGALWTMHSQSSQRWTTRKEYVVEKRWHPMPPPGGTFHNTTVAKHRRVAEPVTTSRWVFETPQAARSGAPLSPDHRYWSDGHKWIPVAGIEFGRTRRLPLRIRRSIRKLSPPASDTGPKRTPPSVS
jgi:hypothetical protein